MRCVEQSTLTQHETTNPALIALALAWDVSLRTWAGYDYDASNRRFAHPSDAAVHWTLWLWDVERQKHHVVFKYSEQTPHHVYGFGFNANIDKTYPQAFWLMPLFDLELLRAGMAAGIDTVPVAYTKTLLTENVLRKYPRAESDILIKLPAGTVVTFVGAGVNYDNEAFMPTRVNGCAGWLSVSATNISG